MTTQLLIAHTGQCLAVDPTQFVSLDDFKTIVARQSSIPANCIIALTIQGKPLKPQTIHTEREICIFDIRVAQARSHGASSLLNTEVPSPRRYSVSNPPNDLRDQRSLASWQDLFKARRSWARKVTDDCRLMASTAQDRYIEMDVMLRCLEAAVSNLESVVRAVDTKYKETKKWTSAAREEYAALVANWEDYLSLARAVPISPAMLKFMTSRDTGAGKGKPVRQPTLDNLVDMETARKTAKLAPAALRKFSAGVADLERSGPKLFQSCDELLRNFDALVARSALLHEGDSAQLLQDIEAVANKIETDHLTTLEYSDSTRDLLQASKIAASHTERLLPTIRNRAQEMDEMVHYATTARNTLAVESAEFMRRITDITSASAAVRAQIALAENEEDLAHFDYLRLIQQIPYVYASFVAESLRRREWFDKIKSDSSTLANEMALFQDEEIKRRRKWHKSLGNLSYGPEAPAAENQVPGLELNLQGEEQEWPVVSKADLDDFYEAIERQSADHNLVDDIGKLIAELSNPTKQQSKRLRAFKNGSVHEAALGRSGLLIRGDDEVLRAMQEDKAKLETRLKTAESRVRRLEDVLHRQTPTGPLGDHFHQPSDRAADPNGPVSLAKSPSLADGRNRPAESSEARLTHRIQQLEAELATERARSAVFEKDLSLRTTQHNNMKGQMDEANSTKKDLLENMESKQREFVEERKSLEDEIKRLQTRLEDTEDEIEHFGESRDNEKATYDARVQELELELELVGKARRDDALKAQGQVEFLRKESKLQRERTETLERQLQAAQDDTQVVTKRLRQADDAVETQLRALQDLHRQILPRENLPDDLVDLIDGVSGKTADLQSRLQVVESDASLQRTELDRVQATIKELRGGMAEVNEKLSAEEMTSMRLKEKIAEEKAKVGAVEQELAEARSQLDQLRVQIADGETGSESLRKRLLEADEKTAGLMEELASRQSHVGSVEEELRLFQDKCQETQLQLSRLEHRFETRTERAKDLTQRLYAQTDRLCRLLERIGFAVVRDGDSMSIQKIPRAERSSMLLSDQNDSNRRSGLLSAPAAADNAEIDLLYWMNHTEDQAETDNYAAFMSALGAFDIDAFSETVYRRVKDVEHLARKLQRDARGYREKAHTLQKESHDKIAFKHFKEGDLAMFLPTRNQTNGAWAAFNIGFPHYFLREQEAHRLGNRDWLVARITRIQEKVVDLSKNLQGRGETASINDEDNDNPFDLSDGLRWYLVEAHEDKPGAPSTPGLGKSTVAATTIEAMADMGHSRTASGKGLGLTGRPTGIDGVSKTLSKSLESRRSSTSSRKALPFAIGGRRDAHTSETSSLRAVAADTPVAASPTLQHAQVHNSSPLPESPPAKQAPPAAAEQQQSSAPEVRIDNAIDALLGP
jgi:autophagy-related protein 11